MQTESPISRRLRELDRTEGWLAKRMGVSPSSVNRWIHGGLPILPHRRRELALALGMRIEDVVPAGTTPEAVA